MGRCGVVARLFRGGAFAPCMQNIPGSEDPGYNSSDILLMPESDTNEELRVEFNRWAEAGRGGPVRFLQHLGSRHSQPLAGTRDKKWLCY